MIRSARSSPLRFSTWTGLSKNELPSPRDETAVWNDGDRTGDDRFDQLDIVASLQNGRYSNDLNHEYLEEETDTACIKTEK